MLSVRPQLIGYPRIGPHRELKWALEKRWSGRIGHSEFESRVGELREAHLAEQHDLLGSAVDDFFLYDELLETAMMFGVGTDVEASTDFDRLSVLARGGPQREAWEMTKWFDTNYHCVVPVIAPEPLSEAAFAPLPWREPTTNEGVIWPVLGPYSLIKLSKVSADTDLIRLAGAFGAALAAWIRQVTEGSAGFRLQLDEPCLGLVLGNQDRAIRQAAYAPFSDLNLVEPALVSVQFGHASPDTLETLGELGFAVQVRVEDVDQLRNTRAWDLQPEHVVAVMDGRSVWPDHFQAVSDALGPVVRAGEKVRIIPSTSLMFLPYTVEGEDLPPGFQFAREKARRLAEWTEALRNGTQPPETPDPPPATWPSVGDLAARVPRSERRTAQADLALPPFPTTSTGSLPQTSEVRHLRSARSRGELDDAAYDAEIGDLIARAIAWQEDRGLDVLVHGEFERTDMVEYFAEQMEGFYTTRNGWVLSYGSRCTRPPILASPPSISEPMTVREWRLAQEATVKPVKGMLTGPVTIVNWSFRPRGVPDDQLFWAVAGPIAHEVGLLVDAGARVVQIDEPAVRERWPLETDDAPALRETYARGVRAALNRVFNQPAHVQMHTHMCYGDFGAIVPLWSDAGVDVASIEFSRSKDDSYIRQFYELFADGHLQIGPGVFDVHSPHTPGTGVMGDRLAHFREFMADSDLWVNPDCGLKTRSWEEIDRQLSDMVSAARTLRAAAEI